MSLEHKITRPAGASPVSIIVPATKGPALIICGKSKRLTAHMQRPSHVVTGRHAFAGALQSQIAPVR
jgi:hypothetical protein